MHLDRSLQPHRAYAPFGLAATPHQPSRNQSRTRKTTKRVYNAARWVLDRLSVPIGALELFIKVRQIIASQTQMGNH